MQMKDEVLDRLAASGANIAQFVSFSPQGEQRFARVRSTNPDHRFASFKEAVGAIYRTQSAPSVNIRTFVPDKPDGNPFLYGLRDADSAADKMRELLAQGYHGIFNETIDKNDGGFSGVLFGDMFEFASCDIPRCVEKPGCAALSRMTAAKLIRAVYGFDFAIPFPHTWRVECSVHPIPVGYLGTRAIVWQAEEMDGSWSIEAPRPTWPNRYSKDIGDKAYGLLMADLAGIHVPKTHVFGRIVPYFSFGTPAREQSQEFWLRTCPREQQPGKFTTLRGWTDPFKLMQREDPEGAEIASIVVQDGVPAKYSGAAITDANGELSVEGKKGYGDAFMVGESKPEPLPARVASIVGQTRRELAGLFGDVRFEWVFDGERVWVVQLHVGRSESSGDIIYPGKPSVFKDFYVSEGLESLRELVEQAKIDGAGITVRGDVGITSHWGDLLRRNKIPSRIMRR